MVTGNLGLQRLNNLSFDLFLLTQTEIVSHFLLSFRADKQAVDKNLSQFTSKEVLPWRSVLVFWGRGDTNVRVTQTGSSVLDSQKLKSPN